MFEFQFLLYFSYIFSLSAGKNNCHTQDFMFNSIHFLNTRRILLNPSYCHEGFVRELFLCVSEVCLHQRGGNRIYLPCIEVMQGQVVLSKHPVLNWKKLYNYGMQEM